MCITVINSYPVCFPVVPGIHHCLSIIATIALAESRKDKLSLGQIKYTGKICSNQILYLKFEIS